MAESVANEALESISFGSKFSSGLDITVEKDGGIRKTVLREGIGDRRPLDGDTVYFNCQGHFEDGSVFESNRSCSEKLQFIVGNGEAIKAWEIGIKSMKRNEVAVFYCQPNYAYGEQGKLPKVPPNTIVIFEIELVSWRGEDVSAKKDGGVLKSRLQEGSNNPPKDGSVCDIHLTGKHNGKVFLDRDAKFTLGEGCDISIVDGVEDALRSMKIGEKALLLVKSRYGYGSEGHERYGVPPDADLEFEVFLESYFPFKEGWMLDDEERMGEATKMKLKGVQYFRKGKYKYAARHFSHVVEYLIEEDNLRGKEAVQRHFLMLSSYLNVALCQLKMGEYLDATHACDEAIKLHPDNEKAYHRRALAHMELGNYEDAVQDFTKVLEINKSNKVAAEMIEKARVEIKEMKKREKGLYSHMFTKRSEMEAAKVQDNAEQRPTDSNNEVNSYISPEESTSLSSQHGVSQNGVIQTDAASLKIDNSNANRTEGQHLLDVNSDTEI